MSFWDIENINHLKNIISNLEEDKKRHEKYILRIAHAFGYFKNRKKWGVGDRYEYQEEYLYRLINEKEEQKRKMSDSAYKQALEDSLLYGTGILKVRVDHSLVKVSKVYINDVWVGAGSARECNALAKKLRENKATAEFVLNIFRNEDEREEKDND